MGSLIDMCAYLSVLVWGGGWLSVTSTQGLQMIDFAGSGVVHMVGGCCGLVAAKLVGARIGEADNLTHSLVPCDIVLIPSFSQVDIPWEMKW